MSYIGVDINNNRLQVGDICNFVFNKTKYEGMIIYDEEGYAYAFEMRDDNFPIIMMYRVDADSISRIINVTETKIDDEYDFYRSIYN